MIIYMHDFSPNFLKLYNNDLKKNDSWEAKRRTPENQHSHLIRNPPTYTMVHKRVPIAPLGLTRTLSIVA
jgi:hypothetical protein